MSSSTTNSLCSDTDKAGKTPQTLAAKFVEELKACALFAETLSLCLESTETRQIELSRRLFVEPATVHNWRTDKRLPDATMVLRIAKGLGLMNAQQRMLMNAWRVTRRARELVPCVEEAEQSQDVGSVLALKEDFATQLASAQKQIQSAKWDNLYKPTDSTSHGDDLDPEIWSYSGY